MSIPTAVNAAAKTAQLVTETAHALGVPVYRTVTGADEVVGVWFYADGRSADFEEVLKELIMIT